MMRLFYTFLFISFFGLLLPTQGVAKDGERLIRVVGRKTGVVTKKEISLTDVAKVYSRSIADDEAILALKRISLGPSPKPGESLSLTASQVLERLREEGVTLSKIGYAFPRVMNVERAARTITELEVETAIREAMSDVDDQSLELKSFVYRKQIKVAPGKISLSARLAPGNKPGRYKAQIDVESPGTPSIRFTVPIQVREWIEVPVAKRALQQGSIVSDYDVSMARVDLSELPVDVATKREQIVGYETKRTIGHGEAFRRRKLVIPPIIENGARVTLQYKTSFLEATASGMALEPGIAGQQIRVRNENSKRTVTGVVVEPGLVRVNQ